MTDSITPPPELVQQWDDEGTEMFRPEYQLHLATRAAQWGADQELEACCEWLDRNNQWARCDIDELRDGRRPKPPSLKEQALGALSRADKDALTNPLTGEVVALRTILNKEQSDTIRRALEALPE